MVLYCAHVGALANWDLYLSLLTDFIAALDVLAHLASVYCSGKHSCLLGLTFKGNTFGSGISLCCSISVSVNVIFLT